MIKVNKDLINKYCKIKSYYNTKKIGILVEQMKELVGHTGIVEDVPNNQYILIKGWSWHPDDISIIEEQTNVNISSTLDCLFDENLLDISGVGSV